MSKHAKLLSWLLLLLTTLIFQFSTADVGTSSYYNPPYLPTACNGNDPTQFPANNFFAAAGDAIWDNGASCGRQYLVRCLSSALRGACTNKTIQIVIVDQASMAVTKPVRGGTTMALSTTAYRAIANIVAKQINIEYAEV